MANTGRRGKTQITKELLQGIVANQRRKGFKSNKEKRLKFCEVQELHLECKHISRIEYLWEFTSLTTLDLNKNCIEKMEGLRCLMNLKYLNLSFNNIMQIEGLESLKELEELNLCGNKISVLENMDSLEKLNLLNMTNNMVKELSQVSYLKKFKHLYILNLCGNPLSEDDYKLYVIAFIPNLKFLDYRCIDSEIKKQASVKFHIELEELNFQEVEQESETEALKAQEAERQIHLDAFVESLNGSFLFDLMLKNDPLENDLRSLPEIVTQQESFKENVTGLCVQLFESGLMEQKRRQAEVDSFFTNHSIIMAEGKQIKTELIQEFEKHLEEREESVTGSQTSEASDYKDAIDKLHKHLLTIEFKLIRQIEKMIKNLDQVLIELVDAFFETAHDLFDQCHKLEDNYHKRVQEIVAATTEKVRKRDPSTEDLSDVFLDEEQLMGGLTSIHENHLLTLQDREDKLFSSANAWKKNLIKRVQEEELLRNRRVLSDITKYVSPAIFRERTALCALKRRKSPEV